MEEQRRFPHSYQPHDVVERPDLASTSLPQHLKPLPGEQWAAWRCVALRGAGFPAAWAVNFGAPACATAADNLLDAEKTLEQARGHALDALQRAFDETEADRRLPLIDAMRRLRKGKPPKMEMAAPAAAVAIERWQQACAQHLSARSLYQQSLSAAAQQTSQAIQQLLLTDRFREAITWQNRHAVHTGIEPLLRRKPVAEGATRTSKQRQQESMIASYMQRYCLKNDTIGFFGPVAWARLVDDIESLNVQPGASMLAERNVRFESWCIDTVANRLAENKELRPWLAPRRVPFVELEGTTLHMPGGNRMRIGAREAAVLNGCDGERTAQELMAELRERRVVSSEAEGYAVLEELCVKGLAAWSLEVPLSLHPERTLRQALERIGTVEIREQALQLLAELEAAREQIALAAGDATQLDRTIGALEEIFTRATGAAPTRAGGRTYAARTLVYEDCRRDIDMEIGSELFDALARPLSLLLASARWFTFETAAIYRTVFKKIYDELARKTGSKVVDAPSFWQLAQPLLFNIGSRPVDKLAPVFQQRWEEVLQLPEGARRVEYTSEELRERVEEAFAAPRPGWRAACYHSPDVMIAAESVEAIQRGDYQLIMGELHLALNTLNASLRVSQHPRPEELIQSLDLDIPEPRLVPVNPKNWAGATARTLPGLISAKDFRLVVTTEPSGVPNSQAVPIGKLVVEETGEGLCLRSRDGKLRFDIVEAFGTALSSMVGNFFHLLAPRDHTPRVSIDGVVVCREAWRFTAADLSFAFEKEEDARFLAARRWMGQHEMPRFVFVKVPVEVKPFYVDFASPMYVEMLAKMMRKTKERGGVEARVSVTEMLPEATQAWLPDAEGKRYTSELRIVAVDYLK
jgi:hypothetical protein